MSLTVPYNALKVETKEKYTVVIVDLISNKHWVERRYNNANDAISHIISVLVTDYEFILYSPEGKYINRYNNSDYI